MLMGGVFHFSRAASLIVGGLVLLAAGCARPKTSGVE
jgi:hypothetical protein